MSDLPDAGSPPYHDPEVLGAFLDAVRWGAVAGVDTRTLQAPFRSGIGIEDYQVEAVARALAATQVNLLIADDVGIGKTIEAGLIAEELLLHHRARRMIVVCPATRGVFHGHVHHRLANIRSKLPDEDAAEVIAHLYAVRDAPTLDAARAVADRFENTYAKAFLAAVSCFRDNREAMLAIDKVPVRHRVRGPDYQPREQASRKSVVARRSSRGL